MDTNLILRWPTDYPEIVQPFGANPEAYRRFGLPGHDGVDIRAPEGTNIHACADGVVDEITLYEGDPDRQPNGNSVVIQHAGDYETVYSHLDRILVDEGETVTAGDVIGLAGVTGRPDISGQSRQLPHLHLGLRKAGATQRGETNYPNDLIDPTPFLTESRSPQSAAQQSARPVDEQRQPDLVADTRALGVNLFGVSPDAIDWQRAKQAGIAFAYVLATEGLERHPRFEEHWQALEKAGILRGACHAFLPSQDALDQAKLFLEVARLGPNDLPPVLVLDSDEGLEPFRVFQGMEYWLAAVERAAQRLPVIRPSQGRQIPLRPAERHPLWVVDYSSSDRPVLPSERPRWTFWEYTHDLLLDEGFKVPVGQIRFNGSAAQLAEWISTGSTRTESTPAPFASFALNDRPEGVDRLGYDDYARAFARVIANPDTSTPLTIGIYGAWGMGKSFLMGKVEVQLRAVQEARRAAHALKPNLLRRLLGRPPRPPKDDFIFIRFNAWVYSGSDNLWAGMVTVLYDAIEKYIGRSRAARLRLRWNVCSSVKKSWVLFAAYGLLTLGLGVLLEYEDIRAKFSELTLALGAVAGGTAILATISPFYAALRELFSSLWLARSEQLAKLSSRRDFRERIGFMQDIKDEIGEINKMLKATRKAGPPPRVVIFIDDLDRCHPPKAVEVLEAIMLLLADEDGAPFVVFLGIDARVIVKAVEDHYGRVLTEAGITGYEYLDKIVQIPFRIPPANRTALETYVESLLYRSEEEREKAEAARREKERKAEKIGDESVTQPPVREPAGNRLPPSAQPEGEALPALTASVAVTGNGRDAMRGTAGRAGAAEATVPPSPPPAEVPFIPEEEETLRAFARGGWLGHNPRRVKRIVNVYRIARLLAGDALPALGRREMIKWTILSEQWSFRVACIMQRIEDGEQSQQPLAGEVDLARVYDSVRAQVESKDARPLAILDADAEVFESFIHPDAKPVLTVGHVRGMRPYTFNLNPALQSEVLKAVAGRIELDLPASAGRRQASEEDEDDRADPDNGFLRDEDSAVK